MTEPATHRDQVKEAFKRMVQITHKGATLLDAGARDSELEPFFEDLGYKWQGVDVDPVSNRVVKMDFNYLNYPDECFDVLFCCHAFEHSETPARTLREFWRVLRPGGVLFLATPNCVKRQILEEDEDHVNVVNEWQMERLLRYTMFKKIYIQVESYKGLEEFQWSLITVAKK